MAKKDGTKFICKLCNEEFTIKYFLKNHLQEIHGRTKMPKEIILEKLKPIEDGHMECLDCNKTFSSKETARTHYKKLHLNKRFTCAVCNKDFTSENCLKKHMEGAHMLPKMVMNESNEKIEWKIVKLNEDGCFNCLDCCKTFSNLRTAKEHHKNVHMTNQNDRKFICKVCKKGFVVEHYMRRHMKEIHMNKETFKCKVCLKTMRYKGSLVKHMDNCQGSKVPNHEKK